MQNIRKCFGLRSMKNSLNRGPCNTILTWILGAFAFHMQCKRLWSNVYYFGGAPSISALRFQPQARPQTPPSEGASDVSLESFRSHRSLRIIAGGSLDAMSVTSYSGLPQVHHSAICHFQQLLCHCRTSQCSKPTDCWETLTGMKIGMAEQ